MSEEYWDGGPSRNSEDSMVERGAGTFIIVNGSRINVDPGTSFADTVRNYAKDAGLGKFRVLLNNEEVKPSMAPDVISQNDVVELRPYDIAGA